MTELRFIELSPGRLVAIGDIKEADLKQNSKHGLVLRLTLRDGKEVGAIDGKQGFDARATFEEIKKAGLAE